MTEQIKIMRGPNIWSRHHNHLLVAKLSPPDLSETTAAVFSSALTRSFPSLDVPVRELEKKLGQSVPLYLAELLALLTLELQAVSVPSLQFSKGIRLGPVSSYAVCEYADEEHGMACLKSAERFLTAIRKNKKAVFPEDEMRNLQNLYLRNVEGPSSNEIIQAAHRRNIPVKKLLGGRYTLLGQGHLQKKIQAAITSDTPHLAVGLAGNKNVTKQLLAEAMLPVPEGLVISTEDELEHAADKLGFPLVTKPLDGHQGKCITTNITKFETLLEGFRLAKSYSRSVVIERYVSGDDFRILLVNHRFVAASRRTPASVTGDGKSTIRQLVEVTNRDPKRGNGHNAVLTKIDLDEASLLLLESMQMDADFIPAQGQVVPLKDTANLSTGGTAEDVTDQVHPANIVLAERASRLMGLDICGLDIVAGSLEVPLSENGGMIIEANAAPGLRMHIAPSAGTARPAGDAIIRMLFPEGEGRIPIVAVTGTNGKTTTARLMAHLMRETGTCTGLTTTEGIYINGEQIVKGDCSGPRSAAVVLHDPAVEFAVLECARGGILRSGLPFDACDYGIVTNVAADHLGLQDIHNIDDMARVKSVVAHAVKKEGYAILNAADALVLKMADDLSCKLALFSLHFNEHLEIHCKEGGVAAYMNERGFVCVQESGSVTEVEHVSNIPVTLKGKAGFMIENVLPTVLVAYLRQMPLQQLQQGLRSFVPNEDQAPGRLNVIEVGDHKVMVDYAHNTHSLQAFAGLMKNMEEFKTGIVTGVGDRRDEDITAVGQLAAEMYDEVIIRLDEDLRGRKPEEIAGLISKGIRETNPELKCTVIPGAREALLYALENSPSGSLIVLNAEHAQKTVAMVKEVKEEVERIKN